MKKKQSPKWFKKVRGSFLPNSWQGWLTYIPYTYLLVLSLARALADNHATLYDRIFNLVVAWVLTATVMNWFASQKS